MITAHLKAGLITTTGFESEVLDFAGGPEARGLFAAMDFYSIIPPQ